MIFPARKHAIDGDFPQQFCESQGRLLISNFRMKFQVPKGTLKDKLAWQLDWRRLGRVKKGWKTYMTDLLLVIH